MARNPAVYPNPDAFDPERYLEEGVDETTMKARDPRNYVFGFGRRRCPGAWMIDSSLWIAIASMLASFDISKAVDEFGKPIEPEVVYDNSVFTGPYPLATRMLCGCAISRMSVAFAQHLQDAAQPSVHVGTDSVRIDANASRLPTEPSSLSSMTSVRAQRRPSRSSGKRRASQTERERTPTARRRPSPIYRSTVHLHPYPHPPITPPLNGLPSRRRARTELRGRPTVIHSFSSSPRSAPRCPREASRERAHRILSTSVRPNFLLFAFRRLSSILSALVLVYILPSCNIDPGSNAAAAAYTHRYDAIELLSSSLAVFGWWPTMLWEVASF
ncbi:hypothetical protein NUW54_g9327 [Trametes sanguinea]|uniref:Uncharacterized protein n=1 Tax=Trametes sanguinea TaxID=158606 RepID=A0ACC1P8J4_9APHY|nr:hypothetical protein NUW54_g9327 [Trametes sanguinea]